MNNKPITVLQVTDTHLFADRERDFLGCKTDESLAAVIQQISQDPEIPDLILLTGDASQDFSPGSYQNLLGHFAHFTCPIYYIPGNHDERAAMQAILTPSYFRPDKSIDIQHWRIVLLDSLVQGKVYGHLNPDQLDFLRTEIQSAGDKHLLIALHHHPVPLTTQWLDPLGVDNANEFLTLIKASKHVQVVLWGHIHQEFTLKQDGILYLATPSTCVQFKPGVEKFTLDDMSPGFRWLRLFPDGRVETHVSRTEGYKPDYDFTSRGY